MSTAYHRYTVSNITLVVSVLKCFGNCVFPYTSCRHLATNFCWMFKCYFLCDFSSVFSYLHILLSSTYLFLSILAYLLYTFLFYKQLCFRFQDQVAKGFLVFILKVAYELLSLILEQSFFLWIHLIYKFECNGCKIITLQILQWISIIHMFYFNFQIIYWIPLIYPLNST